MMDTHELAAVLAEIEHTHGKLDPEDVVQTATDPDHPLHPYFEWNDSKAAHQHRLHQARILIHRVRVEVTYHNITIKAPVYVDDPLSTTPGGGYASVESTPDHTVAKAYQYAITYLERTHAILGILGVPSDLARIITQVERSRDRALCCLAGSDAGRAARTGRT